MLWNHLSSRVSQTRVDLLMSASALVTRHMHGNDFTAAMEANEHVEGPNRMVSDESRPEHLSVSPSTSRTLFVAAAWLPHSLVPLLEGIRECSQREKWNFGVFPRCPKWPCVTHSPRRLINNSTHPRAAKLHTKRTLLDVAAETNYTVYFILTNLLVATFTG